MSDNYPYVNGPVNRHAMGLLGLVDLKNTGKFPDTLGTAIVPTIDITKTIALDGYETFQVSALSSVSALGYASAITVPQGEAWYVANATFRFICAATDYVQAKVGYQDPAAQFIFAAGEGGNSNVLGVAKAANLFVSARDYWLPPLFSSGPLVENFTSAGVITLQANFFIRRCRV